MDIKSEFVIGLFSHNGKRLEEVYNVINSSHSVASFLVGILNLTKIEMPKGYWFAYDFSKKWNLNIITNI